MEDQKPHLGTQPDSERFWKTPNTVDSEPELVEEEARRQRERSQRDKARQDNSRRDNSRQGKA